MEIDIRHLGGVKFEAVTRGHRIICDQPVENRGSDSGMTPPELLLASLGTCAGFYAAEYLRARGLPAGAWKFAYTPIRPPRPRAWLHFASR